MGFERAHVVGHDWGAAVAYLTAMEHPEVVERVAGGLPPVANGYRRIPGPVRASVLSTKYACPSTIPGAAAITGAHSLPRLLGSISSFRASPS